jgi:hypothetical protein
MWPLCRYAEVSGPAAPDMLAPYSRLDPERSGSLELKLTSELIGYRGAELKTKLQIPNLAEDLVERQRSFRWTTQNDATNVDGGKRLYRSGKEAPVRFG